jgi:RNA-directed DNA polymerase
VANLPKRAKPVTGRQATSRGSGRAPRGGRGRRASTERPRNLRGPIGRPDLRAGERTDGRRERITVDRPDRESEGDRVASNRGNARGAKVPGPIHVTVRREEIRWDNHPTTEDSGPPTSQGQPPTRGEVKSGVRLPPKLSELRRKLGQKAEQEPKVRFSTRYDRISRPDLLETAWLRVLAQNGAAGVDGLTCGDIIDGPGATAFLDERREELGTKGSRPQPVKRVSIPKPDGRLRPRGIPTVKDRIVQTAALLVLEPIFEADFLDSSDGFRPGRDAHQAIAAIRRHLAAGRREVDDADLRSDFDTIPQDALLKCLGRRIADRSVLTLIRRWLEGPIIETDERGKTTASRPRQGTPQGGVISPVRAKVSLHWFAKQFTRSDGPGTWAKAALVRSAADFVVLARSPTRRLIDWIEGLLEGRVRLTVNREKARIVKRHRPGERLDFLGFTLRDDRDRFGRGHRSLHGTPSAKALARARERIRGLPDRSRNCVPITEVIAEVNRSLRGWGGYFRHGDPREVFDKLNWYVVQRWRHHFKRRSQRGYRAPEDRTFSAHLVQDLGLRRL